ncbi:MAG: glycoside hydrolase family 2 [Armatimonadetes bacterium]|nr:glycoside hydrolase family 2 [Armatimonadota bacterium]
MALTMLLVALLTQPAWHRVAYEDAGAGQAVFLQTGERYRFSPAEIAELPEALRTVAFGEQVVYGFGGLKPTAAYRLRLGLASELVREQRIKAGSAVLAGRLRLEPGRSAVEEWTLPPSGYADGRLTVTIERLTGPNAVVGTIEVLSTDAKPLAPIPPQPPEPLLTLARRTAVQAELPRLTPRLSPRPADVVSLNGTWQFRPEAGAEPKPIAVPGEWVMQGFAVKPNASAIYRRSFDVPAAWAGQRLKLRFDAVYSAARVLVNGREAGRHEGGFTPFELDITDLASPGANALTVEVCNESLADTLSCGTQYAAHPLGGIPRKVTLFCLPRVNLAEIKTSTRFDAIFRRAALTVQLAVANESGVTARGVGCTVSLDGAVKGGVTIAAIAPGEVARRSVEITLTEPRRWDPEHPNLYRLTVAASTGASADQTIGLRQIEVRGRQVMVNGRPIKLHGVCRHEVHPTLGRSLTPELWRRDAELFKAANCNFIRTSHYPPAEEFLAECDRIGLFVELEAPLCWIGHGAAPIWGQWDYRDPKYLPAMLAANLETVAASYNHPSVLMRSLANESAWSDSFKTVAQYVQAADPTRPTTFHDQCWGGFNNHGSGQMPIGNYHYPGLDGGAKCNTENRPITFGEYCHLNCYNRREIVTDPGVRDDYGLALASMYDAMYHSDNLGGSIWSGIDDLFLLPDGRAVGYGEWGVIDGWRRPKPEYQHVKEGYSPVWIDDRSQVASHRQTPVGIRVENRFDFTDLSELRIAWSTPTEKGQLRAQLPPRQHGYLIVPVHPAPSRSTPLDLAFIHQGREVQRTRIWLRPAIAFGGDRPVLPPARVERVGNRAVISGRGNWEVDLGSGQIVAGRIAGQPVVTGGPHLLLLPLTTAPCATEHAKDIPPLTETCHNWRSESVEVKPTEVGADIVVRGRYDEAAGTYTLSFGRDATLAVGYDFALSAAIDPRQIGLAFDLDGRCDTLRWRRVPWTTGFWPDFGHRRTFGASVGDWWQQAPWSTYPTDHIGRIEGEARARSGRAAPADGRQVPTWPWSLDENALGTADFRATRRGILSSSLTAADGTGLALDGAGRVAARAWLTPTGVRWLAATFHTGGGDSFLSGHYAAERRPLKAGEVVRGEVSWRLLPPSR